MAGMPWAANAAEEVGAGGGGFAGVDLGVGQPGVIVDGAVHKLNPHSGRATGGLVLITAATVRPPSAALTQPSEFFHIDMDQLARPVPLVTANRLGDPGGAEPAVLPHLQDLALHLRRRSGR
ncbi:hypothetical protein GCM10022380_13990 [Amycolatopsis tucumanensis]|uniref:Uncharacterized protein n=1 Tax=Amycolatopsis tucumanensis TaxID=401106 RepID=A0ABP7HRF8_9PSEU